MRKCWNWQTGMTKDHVVPDREGSSPFFRIAYKPEILRKNLRLFSCTKSLHEQLREIFPEKPKCIFIKDFFDLGAGKSGFF